MAKGNAIIGDFSGKLGNLVAYSIRGTQLLRVYQPKVYNPRTARQQWSRDAFNLVRQMMHALIPTLKEGFQGVDPVYTYQIGIGRNIRAVSGTTPVLDYSLVRVSEGNAPSASFGAPSGTQGTSVSFSVTTTPACFTDPAGNPVNYGIVGVAYAPDAGASSMAATVLKSDGTVEIPIPPAWSGLRVHVYAFGVQFTDSANGITTNAIPWKRGGRVSPSSYLGQTAIA